LIELSDVIYRNIYSRNIIYSCTTVIARYVPLLFHEHLFALKIKQQICIQFILKEIKSGITLRPYCELAGQKCQE